MDIILAEPKRIANLCSNCDHNEMAHMKRSGYREDRRVTMKSMTQVPCACRECEKEDKNCSGFRAE